ncbi:uncharacterized protein LOC131944616 isoform X2 [Physella acuta]|uniref:uncharacterized protein LOC131944616 isoform X2 n=1 Tax=Physella acuta TaxID=109671 RepID=UPI0027DE1410|nr:uncharacterized protein LOC131944616 isoform X2 [Physella acuta]
MLQGRNTQMGYPEEILSLPMFHANILSREEARDYMLRHHEGEGSYFVRPNTKNDPTFVSITTSISNSGESCHAKVFIHKHNGMHYYYISERLKFSTFKDLLSYYAEHRIHCIQNIDNIRLRKPLNKNSDSRQQRSGMSPAYRAEPDQVGYRRDQFNTWERTRGRDSEEMRAPTSRRNYSVPSFGAQSHNSDKRPSLSGHPSQANGHHGSSIQRSVSENDGRPYSAQKYANAKSVQENAKMMFKCMPPAPLPKLESVPSDNDFYYTHIDVNKNFFEETYQFLKENELCECGLRLIDSEFPKGWTIHRSHEKSTLNRIFFQHRETTTWEMPEEIAPLLTPQQIQFVLYLCQDGKSPVPKTLRKRLDAEMNRVKERQVSTLSPSNSASSFSPTVNKDRNGVKVLPNKYMDEDFHEPSLSRNGLYEAPEEIDQASGTSTSQNRLRPLSFDSTPAQMINFKAGSPTPDFIGPLSFEHLQQRKERKQHQLLDQELRNLVTEEM